MPMKLKAQLMDDVTVKRALTRLSYEIIEKSRDLENVVLIGIKTRGVPLAEQIAANKKHLNDMGVNYLLNVGPDGLGRIPSFSIDILRRAREIEEESQSL